MSAPLVYTPAVGLALAGEVHAFPPIAKSAMDGAQFHPLRVGKPVGDCHRNKNVARVGHPQNPGLWKTAQKPINMRN
jgi:hypothetical protein